MILSVGTTNRMGSTSIDCNVMNLGSGNNIIYHDLGICHLEMT